MGDMQGGFALGNWLRSMRQLEGWSYADVAAQAGRRGYKVSASNVERMEKVQPVMLKKDQIAWLVDVFGVPPRSVVRMFLQGMGYGLSDSSVASIEDAILSDAQLVRRDKELLSALLAAMRSATRKEGTPWSGEPRPEDTQPAAEPSPAPGREYAVTDPALTPGEGDPPTPQEPNRQSRGGGRGTRSRR